MSGIERTYEEVLRGEKGMKVSIVDVHGIEKGPYMDGAADLQAIPGTMNMSPYSAILCIPFRYFFFLSASEKCSPARVSSSS